MRSIDEIIEITRANLKVQATMEPELVDQYLSETRTLLEAKPWLIPHFSPSPPKASLALLWFIVSVAIVALAVGVLIGIFL